MVRRMLFRAMRLCMKTTGRLDTFCIDLVDPLLLSMNGMDVGCG